MAFSETAQGLINRRDPVLVFHVLVHNSPNSLSDKEIFLNNANEVHEECLKYFKISAAAASVSALAGIVGLVAFGTFSSFFFVFSILGGCAALLYREFGVFCNNASSLASSKAGDGRPLTQFLDQHPELRQMSFEELKKDFSSQKFLVDHLISGLYSAPFFRHIFNQYVASEGLLS